MKIINPDDVMAPMGGYAQGVDGIWQECFGEHKPARATVKADLVYPTLLVEVQAIAVHPAR